MTETTTPTTEQGDTALGADAGTAAAEPWPTTPAVVETLPSPHPERRPGAGRVAGIILAILAVLGLVGMGANQLYRAGANSVEIDLAQRPVPDLARQRALEASVLEDTARYVDSGEWYRVPVARAEEIILKDPSRLGAFPAPKGWIHPDDEKKTKPASK